ncbi:unnamed protein product [Periconia digitata]|uniref:Uncharacterized protein n=1 Tax=Periconia digitata TaxID=1303443 RepID=A0A9W4UC51_9PLEO|nr:unnamed protein product [Periconia digitata]
MKQECGESGTSKPTVPPLALEACKPTSLRHNHHPRTLPTRKPQVKHQNRTSVLRTINVTESRRIRIRPATPVYPI